MIELRGFSAPAAPGAQMHETCTVLLAMLVLVIAVDALSFGVRKQLTR